MLIFIHSFPLASGRDELLQWLVIQVLLTTSEKLADGVHESYHEDLRPLMLTSMSVSPHRK